jgi:hypothetical protein
VTDSDAAFQFSDCLVVENVADQAHSFDDVEVFRTFSFAGYDAGGFLPSEMEIITYRRR